MDARWYRISNRIANPECESVGNLLNGCGQAPEGLHGSSTPHGFDVYKLYFQKRFTYVSVYGKRLSCHTLLEYLL